MHDMRKKDYSKSNFRDFIRKIKWKKILIILIIVVIILFPIEIGVIIGNWISNFFGTIIEIITNG